jgi:23S rRNA (guanosine2251-2'-O)-methyltransferase
LAGKHNIPVYFKSPKVISHFLPNIAHQGIVAFAEKFIYTDLEQLVDISKNKHENALLLAADHITDEGNLGSLVRTAAFFGVHGLILPKDRSAGMTFRVLKRSSGAYVYLPVARITNLGRTLAFLKEKGFWVVGASGDGKEPIWQFDWKRDLVIVLGNEQKGLGRVVEKSCHQIVRIPRFGEVESLNVGVSGGVILSEVCRQRSSNN